jgi:hypothetical protein
MEEYFKDNQYGNGDIITKLFMNLYKTEKYKKILFVRTYTTGGWLDKLLVDNCNVTRILYDTNHTTNKICHKSTILVDRLNLKDTIVDLDTKFDLICLDPFHEYTDSIRDLLVLSSFLTEIGVLLCHDCFPSNIKLAYPRFKMGDWCGVTYVAFVELAYTYPNFFYAVLNIDTGIGIMSKTYMNGLKNNLNIEKQKKLFTPFHFKNHEGVLLNQTYNYYCQNSKDLINMINN